MQIRLVLVAIAILSLLLSSPAVASSSVVTDAKGDMATTVPHGDPTLNVPAYLDIVHTKITNQKGIGRLYFSMTVAAAIPAAPPESFLGYNWFIAADTPGAYTHAVVVRWCTPQSCGGTTGRWEAFVLHTGAPNTPINDFSVTDNTVKAFVDLNASDSVRMLGDADGFTWRGLTRRVSGPCMCGDPVDFAPDRVDASFTP